MNVLCGDYEFTVQNTVEFHVGENVVLKVIPDSIHIMRKMRTINSFEGEIEDENVVYFCGGSFEFKSEETFEKGDMVTVKIPFNAVELTDDENDGTIGAKVTQSLYKGAYYQAKVFTDDGNDFFVDTPYEWLIGDRVGIKIDPASIVVERSEPDGEGESANEEE